MDNNKELSNHLRWIESVIKEPKPYDLFMIFLTHKESTVSLIKSLLVQRYGNSINLLILYIEDAVNSTIARSNQ